MENTNQMLSSPSETNTDLDMLDEYDFQGGRRGDSAERSAERSAEGTTQMKLDPDVAAVFTTSEAVNAVLRALIQTMPEANCAEAAQSNS